jgi:hypothetical protein
MRDRKYIVIIIIIILLSRGIYMNNNNWRPGGTGLDGLGLGLGWVTEWGYDCICSAYVD